MRKSKKDKKTDSFINQQLNNLKEEQEKSTQLIENNKQEFADGVSKNINNELNTSSDYFAEAFRKIDADRISTQLEMSKIDEEIELEEKKREENEQQQRKELLEKKMNELKKPDTEPEVQITEIKEEPKKISFFDKLLNAL
jgi:DNA repair ATPase RecN